MSNSKTTIFAIAHTDLSLSVFNNQTRTLRLVLYVNVDFHSIRIKLANLYGRSSVFIGDLYVAPCDSNGIINDTSFQKCITFNNERNFYITPNTEILTDKIDFQCNAGNYISLSIFYPENKKILSGNPIGSFAIRSTEGDFSKEAEIPATDILKRLSHLILPTDVSASVTTIKEVIVETDKPANVVAAFGDSLTKQGTWTSPLSSALVEKYPGRISFLNLGISGNRLCHDAPPKTRGLYGDAGVKRFKKDILNINGLTHVIIGLGTNDIGLPGKDGLNNDSLISLAEYVEAQTKIVLELKSLGIKVYAVTLIPRKINRIFNKRREKLRNEINDWIRSTTLFDYVIDFDFFAKNDNDKELKPGYYLADGLHLSEEGGFELSKQIPLDLFE